MNITEHFTTGTAYDSKLSCSANPISVNGPPNPSGCDGARYGGNKDTGLKGGTSRSYCEGHKGTMPWYDKCCQFDGKTCLTKKQFYLKLKNEIKKLDNDLKNMHSQMITPQLMPGSNCPDKDSYTIYIGPGRWKDQDNYLLKTQSILDQLIVKEDEFNNFIYDEFNRISNSPTSWELSLQSRLINELGISDEDPQWWSGGSYDKTVNNLPTRTDFYAKLLVFNSTSSLSMWGKDSLTFIYDDLPGEEAIRICGIPVRPAKKNTMEKLSKIYNTAWLRSKDIDHHGRNHLLIGSNFFDWKLLDE